jgi:hypothetical protein
MKRFIIFMFMTKCFFSCGSTDLCNRTEAKHVLGNFSKEYTGLDTIIRTDGYYYHEDSTGLLPRPFMLSNNGEIHILHVRFHNHIQIQERFRDNASVSRGRGSYTLSGDTITARWAVPFQFNCYDIFSGQYVIENDTTLRKIWQELHDGKQRDPVRNEIYKFFKYPVEKK